MDYRAIDNLIYEEVNQDANFDRASGEGGKGRGRGRGNKTGRGRGAGKGRGRR